MLPAFLAPAVLAHGSHCRSLAATALFVLVAACSLVARILRSRSRMASMRLPSTLKNRGRVMWARAPTWNHHLPRQTPELRLHFLLLHPSIPAANTSQIVSVALRHNGGERDPFLLFKDGFACLDMDFVAQSTDVKTHRAANPSDWVPWRRSGGRIELQIGETWEPIPYSDEYAPLPRGTKIAATFG